MRLDLEGSLCSWALFSVLQTCAKMDRKAFQELNANNLTSHVIKVSTENVENERYRALITGLIQHLHDYIRDVQLKPEEWEAAVRYLTQVPHIHFPSRVFRSE